MKKLREIARKHSLRLLVLFGSQAHGTTHKESDIDIAFFPGKKVDEEKLYGDIAAVLKRADIDLVNLFTTHNHMLRYEILSTCALVYEAERGLRSIMEWQSFFDYTDFKRYYDMRSALLDKKLKSMAL